MYYSSDDVEIQPDQYNDQFNERKATLAEQVRSLRERTQDLEKRLSLEEQFQFEDPIAYTNQLIDNVTIRDMNIQLNANAVSAGAEKEITIKCRIPDEQSQQRFSKLEAQITNLEKILGKPPVDYESTIVQDVKDLQTQIANAQISAMDIQVPPQDHVTKLYTQLQLLVGLQDLLPHICQRLLMLQQAHHGVVLYNGQLEQMTKQHQQILEIMAQNEVTMKKIKQKLLERI